MSEAPSKEASLSDVFLHVTSRDRFVQLTSALFCQMREFMIGGFTPQLSQPIIAATDQLGVYAPSLGGYFYLTLFTHVYSLHGACL